MSEPIRPALSRAEWHEAATDPRPHWLDDTRTVLDHALEESGFSWEIANGFAAGVEGDARHALAAICLHERDFGFTWEDVALLRADARLAESKGQPNTAAHRNSLADRLSALLRPREEKP